MNRNADATPVLERIEGMSANQAGKMLGLSPWTISRWRDGGKAFPSSVRRALDALERLPLPEPVDAVDVQIERCERGWRLDAYLTGTASPVQHCEVFTGLRFDSQDDAEVYARRRFGRRIVRIWVRS